MGYTEMRDSCLALAVQDTENLVRTDTGWPNISYGVMEKITVNMILFRFVVIEESPSYTLLQWIRGFNSCVSHISVKLAPT